MSLKVSLLLVTVLLVVGCSGNSDDEELAKLKAQRGKIEQRFEIEDHHTAPVKLTGQPTLEFETRLELFNGTQAGIESADFVVESYARNERKVLFRSKPIHVDKFGSYRFRGDHALLPLDRPPEPVKVRFRMPSEYWRVGTSFRPILVASKVVKPQSLLSLDEAVVALCNWKLDKLVSTIEATPDLKTTTFPEGGDFMYAALASGRLDVVKYLLNHGFDLSQKKGTPRDALLSAVCSDDRATADFVLQTGKFDINRVYGDNRRTALHYCQIAGQREMTKWLLEKGADPNKLDAYGSSPLSLAIDHRELQGARILVAHKADIHWHDKKGLALLHHAVSSPEMCEFLVQSGADVNERSRPGLVTPLMSAARSQGASQWLVQHGADVKLKDRSGRDAFDYASESNTLHTDRFFREQIGAQ